MMSEPDLPSPVREYTEAPERPETTPGAERNGSAESEKTDGTEPAPVSQTPNPAPRRSRRADPAGVVTDPEQGLPGLSTLAPEPVPEPEPELEFIYTLSSTTKYHVLLDQSSGMAEGDRWTNVKRSLFRFIDLLPVGSRLSILAFGAAVKEVLPTTTVTELNRDGLFGRIPRRKRN